MSDYPKLMWSPAGEEITVTSLAEQKVMATEGYRLTQDKQAAEPEPEPELPTKRGRR